MDNLYIRISPELNKLVPSSEAIQAAIDDPGWSSAKPEQTGVATMDDLAYLKKILGFLSAEEIEAMINKAPRVFEPSDPRPDVEALFARVLGDNVTDETVRQLIDGVVALIRRRERWL